MCFCYSFLGAFSVDKLNQPDWLTSRVDEKIKRMSAHSRSKDTGSVESLKLNMQTYNAEFQYLTLLLCEYICSAQQNNTQFASTYISTCISKTRHQNTTRQVAIV